MKQDTEVKLYMQERRKGTAQRIAAARAGMSERTARKYEKAGQLPSQLKRPHTWATRQNPFEQDWEWVVEQLKRDPAGPRIDVVWIVVRATSRPLSAHTSPHPATAYCQMASHAWTRTRSHLSTTAQARRARPI